MSKKPTFSPDLQLFLFGRHLLHDEIPFPSPVIDAHQTQGFIAHDQGVTKTKQSYQCQRCGNHDSTLFAHFPCARCQQTCVYCRNCIMMGRVSECTPLYRWTGPPPEQTAIQSTLQWSGQLSPGQQAASEQVIKAIQSNQELLVWAVCGAGKTEVLFHGIEEALTSGKRVCIATPRTDVVLELAPRFQKVFPAIQVTALYGGSPDRDQYSPLVISTTHQLFRFKQTFDVMIVDEVDAFPYTFDPSLQFAVEKARSQSSTLIFLTATPSAKWQMEYRLGKRKAVTIPARYHRHPLPIPSLRWCGNWKKSLKKNIIPTPVKNWLYHRIQIKKQTLLFLPNIEIMEKALPLFQQLHPNTDSVHAEDPSRKEKVEKMRAKQTFVLLTTTILERGVTFPHIDVAVIGAEDRIFTESALVQIAGRAGRSAQFPDGDVVFFHYGKTNEMVKAVFHIDSMNKEARKKGLLL
ncbi:competence protein ComFA [Oikeobacillus pervagus]|uniref:Competence protein ComFA n=1 Tax=Oikeobacillus pervagus TaxID=1325931 RepID=A0AAJ1T1J5_9BACI|nr:DEAD/DEAH box helicase [Oikeobacillus pervagus]MDQ0214961.1 competence protein ComFA [Oikeobacillus pervagus]